MVKEKVVKEDENIQDPEMDANVVDPDPEMGTDLPDPETVVEEMVKQPASLQVCNLVASGMNLKEALAKAGENS